MHLAGSGSDWESISVRQGRDPALDLTHVKTHSFLLSSIRGEAEATQKGDLDSSTNRRSCGQESKIALGNRL
jgi:hypothetical protein